MSTDATLTTDPDRRKPASMAMLDRSMSMTLDLLSKLQRSAHERIAALEARIAELEQRPSGVEYAGVYEQGRAYTRGVLTTRSARAPDGWRTHSPVATVCVRPAKYSRNQTRTSSRHESSAV